MFEGYITYGALATTSLLVAIVGLTKKFKYQNALIVILFTMSMPLGFIVSVDLLSRPRPVELMLPFQVPNVKKADMLAAKMVEGKYILLLLDWKGLDYPRYFKFPWNRQMAEQIQQAKRGAQRADGSSKGVVINKPFDPTLERRRFKWANPKPQEKVAIRKQRARQEIIRLNRQN